MMNWMISSSLLILVIIALRFLLKGKISLRLQYGLWAVVLVRLLFPFSVGETVLSFSNWLEQVRDTERVQQVVEYVQTPIPSMSYDEAFAIVSNQYAENGVMIDKITGEIEDEVIETMQSDYTPAEVLQIIWIFGMFVTSAVFLLSNIHFFNRIKKSRVYIEEISCGKKKLCLYKTAIVDTPCLYGIFRPAIYAREDVFTDGEVLRHVIEHESTHYRHKDHIWSLFRVICLILHWYNPFVWYAAVLSREDAELACDEATIARLGEAERASYGRALIGLTCEKRPAVLIAATTMTGSAKSIKERIARIVKQPRMAGITLAVVILVVVFAVIFTYTGAKTRGESTEHTQQSSESQGTENQDIGDNSTEEGGTENTELVTEDQYMFQMKADINHDGYEDLFRVFALAVAGRVTQQELYFKIYLGKADQTFETEAVYTSNVVASSHSANGTYVISEKDGKEYLIYSIMYEMMGYADYQYEVMYLDGTSMTVVQSDKIGFCVAPWRSDYWNGESPIREDVVPEFREKFEPWIENAEIIVSFDVATSDFSSRYGSCPAFAYYDLVWQRNEKLEIYEFEQGVGKEEWMRELYWRSEDYTNDKKWLESLIDSEFSEWYTTYDGSKLQRIDNCIYSNSVVQCGVIASCDIIFYRENRGENLQSVLYKMIEKMIQARMETSAYRTSVITDYAIPEQNFVQVSENVWFIPYIQAYYAFEGVELGGTMQDYITSGITVTEEGLIPMEGQGSESNFFYILIEKDGVYRLQRMGNMK